MKMCASDTQISAVSRQAVAEKTQSKFVAVIAGTVPPRARLR